MSERIRATCIVQLEVACCGVWGSECTMDQIIKQASDSAKGRIGRLFHDSETKDKDLSTKRSDCSDLQFLGINKVTTRVETDR